MRGNAKALLTVAATLLLAAGLAAFFLAGPHTTADGGENTADAAPAATPDRGGAVWGANYFPNVPLVTHEGKTVRFFDDLIAGKVVAINFVYTTCPDACPMETARLLEVQELLGDRMGDDVFFYSITIDPENDTPEVLARFVADWHLGPGWTFLTGKEEDITLLRRKLGLYIEEIQGPDSRDHNLSLVIGNQATGRWMKRSPFENPYVLAKQIGGELHNWKIASTTRRDYSEAPELRQVSKGETLYRTRCAACHTIGDGDLRQLAARRIGPDLYQIGERRDPDWLRRWLAEPDVMLAEGDPLALELMAAYNDVPMPNMRLNQVEVEAILEHIAEASERVRKHVEMGHRRDPLADQSAQHEGHGDHHAGDHGGASGDHAEPATH